MRSDGSGLRAFARSQDNVFALGEELPRSKPGGRCENAGGSQKAAAGQVIIILRVFSHMWSVKVRKVTTVKRITKVTKSRGTERLSVGRWTLDVGR